jgi:peroxiredoxin
MSDVTIGERAPSFRLPSGQGPDLGPDDFRGRSNLIIWFAKGMVCPFCRQQMSQLMRGYPQFQALNTEILEVTPAPPQRARVYAQKFRIPFPYLSDADCEVRRLYGVDRRSRSLGGYVSAFIQGARMPLPPEQFENPPSPFSDLPGVLADDDMGFYILDKGGIVQYALAGSYETPAGPRSIPSNEEIVRELQRCEQAEGRGPLQTEE